MFSYKLPHLKSLWMLVAALGFATMGAFVKIGAAKFTGMELVFYRSLFGFGIIWLTMLIKQLPAKTPVLGKQISRALVGFMALILFFYAIAHLPLATAMTLNYTSGLFLGVLTPIFLREKPKKWTIFALVMGFAGIGLLLKPSLHQNDWLAATVGLLSGIGAAFAYLFVKQLAQSHEPDWRTVFYFTLVSSVLSGLFCIIAGIWWVDDAFHALTFSDMPTLLGMGIAATVGQLAMTRAYRTGNTLVVACLAYFTVIFACLFGAFFWGEKLDAQAWVAIGLIILSGIISTNASKALKA